MLFGNFDLLVTLDHVFVSVDRICLGGLNDRLLLLDDSGQLLVEDSKLGESLLDALKLAVTGANVAKYRAGMPGAICSQLRDICISYGVHKRHVNFSSMGLLTAVWKTPSLPQSALAAS